MMLAHTGTQFMGIGWALHCLFALALFLGLVLFVVWAAKTLKGKDLKKLVIWLLAIGLIGMILTSFLTPWGGGHYKGTSKGIGDFPELMQVTGSAAIQ